MTWIKRNLIFVITALVGVLLIGWAAYSLMGAMSDDAQVKTDFDSVMNELTTLRNMNPYPTPDNIDAAKAEAAQMRALLGDFQKVFVPFPPVKQMDEKAFAEDLARHIALWQSTAKTAAVKIPDQYAFSFSGLTGLLTFPTNCIPGWLEQFNELQGICDILFRAHVNELVGIQRVPVLPCDAGGNDFLATTWVTNQLGVAAPYQISFVSFSRELGQVLDGFLTASNCYIVKSVIVEAAKGQTGPGSSMSPVPMQSPVPYTPPRDLNRGDSGPVPGRGGPVPGPAPARTPAPVYSYRAAAPSGPVTVIREKPLFVTIVVDAIQLKPVAAAR